MDSDRLCGFPEPFLRAVVERLTGDGRRAHLEASPLHGGLVAPDVCRVWARLDGGEGRRVSFVVKRLRGAATREAEIYRQVVASKAADLGPKLLGTDREGDDVLLALEWVRPFRRWPWNELELTCRVARRIAELHHRLASVEEIVPTWDYEDLLSRSARETVELVERLGPERELRRVRRALTAARRVTDALPELRRRLLAADAPIPRGVIHGDLHPGNIVLRQRGGRPRPVLLDWSRLRHGSPLEDVSSWLLSLTHWEAKARRRHDTILCAYLEAWGGLRPTREVRDHYWWSAACNALAGALRYQIVVTLEERGGRAAADALRVAEGWARTLQRADEACSRRL